MRSIFTTYLFPHSGQVVVRIYRSLVFFYDIDRQVTNRALATNDHRIMKIITKVAISNQSAEALGDVVYETCRPTNTISEILCCEFVACVRV